MNHLKIKINNMGDEISEYEMVEACGTYGGQEKCLQDFVRKPEGKRPVVIPTCMRKDNIKVDFK